MSLSYNYIDFHCSLLIISYDDINVIKSKKCHHYHHHRHLTP